MARRFVTPRLQELSIRGLGVIDSGTLPVGPGFTAITGETGAGKTMVLQALALLRGERADSGAVRRGADRASVQGIWEGVEGEPVASVEDAGGELDDGDLILGRTVAATGRSRAQAGGVAVPAGVLASVTDSLVAVHGQADQQRLKSPAAQRAALDRAAGHELQESLAAYRERLHAWQRANEQLEEITENREARRREATMLREELDQIAAVDPQPGEDIELEALAHRLEHGEALRAAIAEARTSLSSDEDAPDALTLVGVARRLVEREEDPLLAPVADQLIVAETALAEASSELVNFLDALESPSASPDEVQARLHDVSGIVRRFGSIEDALQYGADGALRIAELDDDDASTERLAAEVERERAAAQDLAETLTGIRTRAAEELQGRVEEELRTLAMPNARVAVEVAPGDELLRHGRDEVRILLAPHPGVDAKPVATSASGGELSRVMLAIEVALSAGDVPTLVFDEVDAGVGGEAAIEVGRRLAKLAEHSQVIVVTHLAQVAAFASTHVRIEKGTDGEVTSSSIAPVVGEARVSELARMLAGTDSEVALAHARELLADGTQRSK
ncbi:DNA repair protein RecN [uncultured Agrococcus sp.]|uniref:DNA repair protein RecN n=1 Tax=uncultured Agrococcus sp. TaxID=382258 RepID=UPI0025DF7D04|nr:DNA repair protein RecN [uncultured Agrococcus sp.]